MTDASRLSRRILALALPRLATDRLRRRAAGASWCSDRRADAEPPLAVFERIGPAFRLAAVCDRAAAVGLTPGDGVAEARARLPGLELVERDAEGELDTLEDIADWCDRFTPLVGLDRDFGPEPGLVLDVSGCAHLFGGEAALAAALVDGLERRGFAARAAIAGSAAAARAVVRHGLGGERWRVIASGDDVAAVAPLPVAAIIADAAVVAGLARAGLVTVAQLAALPRAALARRFGADLVDRLDEAAGRRERPISPRRPVPVLSAERRLVEPILTEDEVLAVITALAGGLAGLLEARGEGARLVEAALHRLDGRVERIVVGSGRPTRDPAMVRELFRERLKGEGRALEAEFGFDLVRLSVSASAPYETRQIDLAGDGRAAADFEQMVDRLGARLGSNRITRMLPGASHLPEAAAIAPAARTSDPVRAAARWAEAAGPAADEPPERPPRLLTRPEPIDTVAALPDGAPVRFRWRRALYEVERAEGPERIAAEWWRAPFGAGPEGPAGGGDPTVVRAPPGMALTRDYFRVEERAGRRFWVFREGLFARETERPRWFLHGIFA